MQEEKWFEKYVEYCSDDNCKTPHIIPGDQVEILLQEHTERIIKEIEGMRRNRKSASEREDGWEMGWNAALDTVINHLKKEI